MSNRNPMLDDPGMMDPTTFQELLDAGELGLILMDGGKNLTPKQMRQVKEKAKEQVDEAILKKKMELAKQPGYTNSILVPLIRKVLEQSGVANAGETETPKTPAKPSEKMSVPTDEGMTKAVAVEPKIKPVAKPKKYAKRAIEKESKKSAEALSAITDIASFFDFIRADSAKMREHSEDFQKELNSDKQKQHKEIMDIIISATKNKTQAEKKIKKTLKEKKKEKPEEKKEEAKPPTKPGEAPPKTEAPKVEAPKAAAPKAEAPAPKVEPAKGVTPPTAQQVPIKPTVPTVKPAAPAPTVPKIPSATTVGKAAVATAAGVGISKAIGAAESGGNYNITYGDRFDKKMGKTVSSLKSKTDPKQTLKTPQDLFGKPLTELTLDEVRQFQKYKDSEIPGTGAVGKYQFMPSTLFGRKDSKGNIIPGLVQELNMPMSTKFDESTQDKLFELLHSKDVSTLKRLGVPVTPGFEYMAHYIGAGGTNAVYKAIQENKDITVAQALMDAGLKVGQNEELYKIKISEFEKILEGRLIQKGGFTPHSAGEATPNKIMDISSENAEMKKFMRQSSGQQVFIQQNVNNTVSKQPLVMSPKKQELNPTMQ